LGVISLAWAPIAPLTDYSHKDAPGWLYSSY